MIKPLPNPTFVSEFIKLIDAAKTSIVLVNYLAQFSGPEKKDPLFDIARALARAARRGVKATVFLEGAKFENNYAFYRYIKDKGVDAWLDTSQTFIHQKVLCVDEKFIITGSHNLTRASFELSEEFSVLTDDEGVIRAFREGLVKISAQRDEIKGRAEVEHIALPVEFVKGVCAPLYRIHSELAFDLYMLLCLEDGGSPRALPIDEKKWGSALGFTAAGAGLSAHYRRNFFTQRVNRLLGPLKKKGLIVVDREADMVTRVDVGKDARVIKIPKTYWTSDRSKKFSFAAKYFYFISLAETLDSPFYPWWSLSMRALKKRYGCDHGIGKGALLLEKLGILEILRAIPVKRGDRYSEEAQYYRI